MVWSSISSSTSSRHAVLGRRELPCTRRPSARSTGCGAPWSGCRSGRTRSGRPRCRPGSTARSAARARQVPGSAVATSAAFSSSPRGRRLARDGLLDLAPAARLLVLHHPLGRRRARACWPCPSPSPAPAARPRRPPSRCRRCAWTRIVRPRRSSSSLQVRDLRQPSFSASCGPTWAVSPSIACRPQRTMSGCERPDGAGEDVAGGQRVAGRPRGGR